MNIVNKLIHLFNDLSEEEEKEEDENNRKKTLYSKYFYYKRPNNKNTKKIKINEYLKEERKLRGLGEENVEIVNYVYNEDINDPTLHLGIIKNNKDFLHLTIHLSPNSLDAKDNGMIHFKKDLYVEKRGTISKTKIKKYVYALIAVEKPADKLKSLEFSIADGYSTPMVTNSHIYDSEIQEEMDAIISLLNKLFDENNNELYIGNIKEIHKKTNTVLKSINTRKYLFKRKNYNEMINPLTNTISSPFGLTPRIYRKTPKKQKIKFPKKKYSFTLKKSKTKTNEK